jgi:hypothetical protein
MGDASAELSCSRKFLIEMHGVSVAGCFGEQIDFTRCDRRRRLD